MRRNEIPQKMRTFFHARKRTITCNLHNVPHNLEIKLKCYLRNFIKNKSMQILCIHINYNLQSIIVLFFVVVVVIFVFLLTITQPRN